MLHIPPAWQGVLQRLAVGYAELTYDEYRVGYIRYNGFKYIGECSIFNGIVKVCRTGYVLIVGGVVKQLFNKFRQPMDWLCGNHVFHIEPSFTTEIVAEERHRPDNTQRQTTTRAGSSH